MSGFFFLRTILRFTFGFNWFGAVCLCAIIPFRSLSRYHLLHHHHHILTITPPPMTVLLMSCIIFCFIICIWQEVILLIVICNICFCMCKLSPAYNYQAPRPHDILTRIPYSLQIEYQVHDHPHPHTINL